MTETMHRIYSAPGFSGTAELRLRTAPSHQQVERSLDLPNAIADLDDYCRWLARFLGLYQPLEVLFACFPDWAAWGVDLDQTGHSRAIRADLLHLAFPIDPSEFAPPEVLPPLLTFAEAFGALYVIEGSKLGGRFILKELEVRIGREIDGATAFFTGNGAQSGARWNAFKDSLDRFVTSRPLEFEDVLHGAEATFASIQTWMSPLLLKASV